MAEIDDKQTSVAMDSSRPAIHYGGHDRFELELEVSTELLAIVMSTMRLSHAFFPVPLLFVWRPAHGTHAKERLHVHIQRLTVLGLL